MFKKATGKERNGFYKDGSYIDHQDVPYTGAYGVVLLEGISQMMPMIKHLLMIVTKMIQH